MLSIQIMTFCISVFQKTPSMEILLSLVWRSSFFLNRIHGIHQRRILFATPALGMGEGWNISFSIIQIYIIYFLPSIDLSSTFFPTLYVKQLCLQTQFQFPWNDPYDFFCSIRKQHLSPWFELEITKDICPRFQSVLLFC